MIRKFPVYWMFIVFLCLTGCTRPEITTRLSEQDKAKVKDKEAIEYAVYSALIKEMYVKDKIKLIAIEDRTALHPLIGDDLLKELERVRQKMPVVSQELVADFIEKNEHPHRLDNAFNLSVPYTLISEKESEEIFQDSDGWQTFYKKYPASQGLMTLSRVGFDRDMRRALVYVGNQRAGFGGAGYYVLLTLENGSWIIKDDFGAWVS